jgi:hypothetical protein
MNTTPPLYSMRVFYSNADGRDHHNEHVGFFERRSDALHVWPDADVLHRLAAAHPHNCTFQVYPADAARATFYVHAALHVFYYADSVGTRAACSRGADNYLYFAVPPAAARAVVLVAGPDTWERAETLPDLLLLVAQ